MVYLSDPQGGSVKLHYLQSKQITLFTIKMDLKLH